MPACHPSLPRLFPTILSSVTALLIALAVPLSAEEKAELKTPPAKPEPANPKPAPQAEAKPTSGKAAPQSEPRTAPKKKPASNAEAATKDSDNPVWTRPRPDSLEDLRAIQRQVQEMVPKVRPATVCVLSGAGSGSGVIVSEEGLVLTAGHISDEPDRNVTIVFPDGAEAKGKTLGVSWLVDAGMVQITDPGPWPIAPTAPPGSSEIGHWCFALGHPDGYQKERGVVVRVGRIINKRNYVLQTDCRLLGGDSGGPLFDMEGRVIGIHSRIAFNPDENFHAPIESFDQNWDRLVSGDVMQLWPQKMRGFLGVRTGEREKGEGVKVDEVIAGSAASDAGVKKGDIILKVNGQLIQDPEEFSLSIGGNKKNETITLHIERNKKSMDKEIKLGEWPDPRKLQ